MQSKKRARRTGVCCTRQPRRDVTNRYVTEAEKAGQRRRMARYRERLLEQGRKPRQFTLTAEEEGQVRAFIAEMRANEGSER